MVDKRNRVTSFDVAARAGVSQSTVSRALSGSQTITDATRTRVMEAARALGYYVDERAARLRRGHTGTLVTVVISRPGDGPQQINPFSYALLGSICSAAAHHGFEVLVPLQAEEESLFGHYVDRNQADGMIVIGTTANQSAWDYFRKIGETGQPIAYWGSPLGDLDWISSDNVQGTRLAVQRLVEAGYRRIACIGAGELRQRQFTERVDAYVEAMAAAGLEPILVPVEPGLERDEQGRRAIAGMLASGLEFDAVFAVCDAIAFGALDVLRGAGIAVPGEIGVVGFDGLPAGELASPPLTTIEPDFATAGTLLVEAVLGEGRGDNRHRVPVRLLERGSVRSPA
ncbi:MAG: LacI family DNA-binding transcriptional regulator [Sphingomonadales bacterium]|nr:LacI family DNA-binding transcriptional regulator [Sphingomonadales bacterium]MBD3772077.1 LacI family DNA-binding transcriptional regulator [Paracoccaceae bacterium]